LPSRAFAEQPPNDINVVRKPAPLDYQTPSEDREKKVTTYDVHGRAGTEDTDDCNQNEKLTFFTKVVELMPKKAEAVFAQLNKTSKMDTQGFCTSLRSRIIYCES
jgi:hypothetical protein